MKNKNVYMMLLSVFVVFAVLIAGGYLWYQSQAPIGGDKYVFIQHFIQTNADVVGNSDILAYPYLGYFKTYNNTRAEILATQRGTYFPLINSSLKVFFANGSAIGPQGCHGTTNDIYGAYDLPYRLGDFTIIKVGQDGTAFMEYTGQDIVLGPGENRIVEKTEFLNVTADDGTPLLINITVTDRITNYGLCDK